MRVRAWKEERDARPRRRIRLFRLLLMVVGAATLIVIAARYVVVPLLVYLGGRA